MEQKQMQRDAQATAMQTKAGAGGGPGGGGGAMPMGQQMTQDGTDPTQPQNPNEVPRPQSAMGSAVDASVGRAANPGFFPG